MHRTATTTCRCGYATPSTVLRCLGCGRRLAKCARVVPVATAAAPARPAVVLRPTPVAVLAAAPAPAPVWSARDAQRFGAPALAVATTATSPVPFGALVVAGLVAAAWIEPDAPRPQVLTAAALLGAALAAVRPAGAAGPSDGSPEHLAALPLPSRLSDDELRDAIAAW